MNYESKKINLPLITAFIVCAGLVLQSCGAKKAGGDTKPKAHEHHAPHGGTLIVLGEEFAHVELILNPADGSLRAYVLDHEAEQPIRIEQQTIDLKITTKPASSNEKPVDLVVSLHAIGNPLTGEKPGDTSEFTGQADALKGAAKFRGAIQQVKINGQNFDSIAFDFPEGNDKD